MGGTTVFRRLQLESLEPRQLLTAWPWHWCSAPYVDTTLYPAFDLASAAQASGNKYYTLAFIVAGSTGEPAWGGQDSLAVSTGYMSSQITALRALGGNVVVSFGGATGRNWPRWSSNPTTLQADYQQVVNEYNLTRLGFRHRRRGRRRARFDRPPQPGPGRLAAGQRRRGQPHSNLAHAAGAAQRLDGRWSLRRAIRRYHGVSLSGVNVMAMDYGDSCRPNPAGQMGTYAIDAAESTCNQLRQIYTPPASRCPTPVVAHSRHHADDRCQRPAGRSLRSGGRQSSRELRPTEQPGRAGLLVGHPRFPAPSGHWGSLADAQRHHANAVSIHRHL